MRKTYKHMSDKCNLEVRNQYTNNKYTCHKESNCYIKATYKDINIIMTCCNRHYNSGYFWPELCVYLNAYIVNAYNETTKPEEEWSKIITIKKASSEEELKLNDILS